MFLSPYFPPYLGSPIFRFLWDSNFGHANFFILLFFVKSHSCPDTRQIKRCTFLEEVYLFSQNRSKSFDCQTPTVDFPTPTADFLTPTVDLPYPMVHLLTPTVTQKHSHRNSVQNGPIEKSTALTGAIFVTISVLMSRGDFRATFGQLLVNFRTTFGQPMCLLNRYTFLVSGASLT